MAKMHYGSRPHDAENSSQLFQSSKEKTSVLAQRYGLSRTAVTKWRSRITTSDSPMATRQSKSKVLSAAEEAVIVEFRKRTLLPL
jgi:transposase